VPPQGIEPLPPDPQVVGLYLAASASEPPAPGKKPNAVRTIERRLSAIAWNCAQRGQPLDRADRHIAEVMRGIRRRHGRPPDQKEAVFAEDLMRMVATLDHGLRGLRDRAILLIGFAGGLRRSEITGLDCGPEQTEEGAGWIEFLDQGVLIRVRGKTGWREVEIGRGSSDPTCPVVALQTWLKLGRIAHGPLFRRITGGGKEAGPDRLTDRHVAAWSSARRSPPGFVAISPKPSGGRSSPDIRCGPASPPPRRSTSATCKSSSATPAPR
jgi:integrase